MSAGTTEIQGHPRHAGQYRDAIAIIFDLTNAGTDTPSPQQTTPDCIIDSTGQIVFSADNPADMKLLQEIDQNGGLLDLEVTNP